MATSQQLREQASQHEQNSADSFDRCDTDGFVSQWASGINAQLCRAKADIADNHGNAFLHMLCDKETGKMVEAKAIPTQYGASWLLSPKAEKTYGRKWIPCGANSRIQKQLGLEEKEQFVPAYARIVGNGGTGLSGATSCRVVTLPDYREMGWEW